MRLIEIAHARAGDKGNIVTLSVIAYRRADFGLIAQQVTAELRLKANRSVMPDWRSFRGLRAASDSAA